MRSEGDILAGVLTVVIGGEPFSLRELPIVELREWKGAFTSAIEGLGNLDPNSSSELGQLMDLGSGAILDLVVLYDKASVLGGKDAVEKVATETEVYRAFRVMLDAAFPFVQDAMTAYSQVQKINPAGSVPLASTNGLSPIGAPARKSSKRS
jgi:hypothetical protein